MKNWVLLALHFLLHSALWIHPSQNEHIVLFSSFKCQWKEILRHWECNIKVFFFCFVFSSPLQFSIGFQRGTEWHFINECLAIWYDCSCSAFSSEWTSFYNVFSLYYIRLSFCLCKLNMCFRTSCGVYRVHDMLHTC